MRTLTALIVASAALTNATLTGAASAQEAPATNPCAYDFGAMMRLDVDTFDSTPGSGWRTLGDRPGCEAAAADLLALYRTRKLDVQRRGLMHHEAQMRTAAGQTEEAIALVEQVLAMETAPEMITYREAELAFLRNDRPALLAARDRLIALPPPEGFEAGVARFRERFPGQTPPSWPLNVDTIDGFVRCFGRPWLEAYGCRSD